MLRHKLDTSLAERLSIIRHLESLKEKGSLEELEGIGRLLEKSGNWALRPLLRRLWLENSGDLIGRYLYLLDFFPGDYWLDHLIRLVLTRRDLNASAKAAIRATLVDHGVEVDYPPLSTLLGCGESLPGHGVFDGGEEGLLAFMEQFLLCRQEIRLMMIAQLAQSKDPMVVDLLEIMLRIGDDEVTAAALRALGRVRDQAAAAVLNKYLSEAAEPFVEPAARSLRRLSFLGIDSVGPVKRETSTPFHICCAGPPDGDGYRSLLFARASGRDCFAVLCLQLHETWGIIAARGYGAAVTTQLEEELTGLQGEEAAVAVQPEYALTLLRDALYRNMQTATELPAEFYLHSGMFTREELIPSPHEPAVHGGKQAQSLTPACLDEIFDDDFFSCWFMTDSRIYDFAAQWREIHHNASGRERSRACEAILERFCGELFPPQLEQIERRLLLVADLMGQAGRPSWLVDRTRGVAASIAESRLPCHFHPFLRRFALESLEMAREAMEEGFEFSGCSAEAGEDWDD